MYISHFANKSILSSELIICCSVSIRGERRAFFTHTSGEIFTVTVNISKICNVITTMVSLHCYFHISNKQKPMYC